jgi:hypothetical protein
MTLLTPIELDGLLRYPRGRSQRLARRQLLPHITLPDGAIRFRPADVEKLLGVVIRPPDLPTDREAANAR